MNFRQTTATPQNQKLKASPRVKNVSPTLKPRPNGPPSRCPQSPQGLRARCSRFQVGSPIHRMCTFVRRGSMGPGTQALSLAVQEESKGTPSQIPPLMHGLSGYGLCFTIVHPGSPPPISTGVGSHIWQMWCSGAPLTRSISRSTHGSTGATSGSIWPLLLHHLTHNPPYLLDLPGDW